MINRFALIVVASACCAMPAVAEEIGVGVGPVGVTVGSGPDRVVREREIIREREPRREEKVIIKKRSRSGRGREEGHHRPPRLSVFGAANKNRPGKVRGGFFMRRGCYEAEAWDRVESLTPLRVLLAL